MRFGQAGTSMFLATMLAACGGGEGNGGPQPPAGNQKLTVVVLVVDSLMPGDIGPLTPNLAGLMDQGTFYPESRAVFSAETIPNHVAMMTGVYPQRSGIPTNNFLDFDAAEPPEERDLSLPEELAAKTMFTWITQQCRDSGINPDIRHGATLSKKYLHEIFAGDALDAARENRNPAAFNVPPDSHWDPTTSPLYIGPGSEHTPDIPTMQQALSQLPDVDFLFINLGDVDRSAHAGGALARALVIADTDMQVGRLVSALQSADRWNHTVMIVVSDHGMDYTLPGPLNAIITQGALDDIGACTTPLQAVQNGGTDSIYVLDRSIPDVLRQAALQTARACLLGMPECLVQCPTASAATNGSGIAYAWYTEDNPLDPSGNMPANVASRHPNLGDLVLVADQGFKFSEPDESGNLIPGNHGHVATFRNFMLVTGGVDWVKKGVVVTPSVAGPALLDRLPEQSENIDVAPTVAWILGLGIQSGDLPDGGGFDGRVLSEAFTQFDGGANAASPSSCGLF